MVKWIQFISLFVNIFGKDLPDLNKIQKQGLLAVKIGQTFALRIDFLGEEKCSHLAKLYSEADSIKSEDFERLLNSYTNQEWRSNFLKIEPKPLGAASVGQVHKATLKTGEQVVIKLIKADFKKKFEADVRSFRRFIRFIIFFYPPLAKVADPIGILKHIEEYTLAELNLLNEIKNGKRLKEIYELNKANFDLSRLKFPKVYENLSSENVLVTEFIDGETVDKLIARQALPFKDLIEIFRIQGFYIFLVGTFHGDIHPGNMIYKNGMFYFIDTGAISKVGKKIQTGLFEFMRNLAYYDYESCAVGLNHMAEKEISGAAFDKYRLKLLDLYKDFKGMSVSEMSLTKKMMQTIRLGVLSGMEFETGMYPIIKSMMYLDGIVLKGSPNTILMEEMRPFLEEFKSIKAEVRV
jgi:ubiquinone biosynthesis protein